MIKRKKFISAIAASVLVALVIIIAVFTAPHPVFKENPAASDSAVGNGGMAVLKGDYLYFVNGYVPAGTKNSGNKITLGAIYRAKAEGVKFNYPGDEHNSPYFEVESYGGLITNKSTGSIEGAERLVSKIAGFEHTQLFIFGNMLYFTSPSTTRQLESGVTNIDSVDIWQIKLNGTGLKRIYTIMTNAENPFYNGQVNFFKNGNDIYGIFYDGYDKLAIYKNSKKYEIKTGVSQLAMPSFTEEYVTQDVRSKQVLVYIKEGKIENYTFPSTDGGHCETSAPIDPSGVSINFIALKDGILYYTRNNTTVHYVNARTIGVILNSGRELPSGTYDKYIAVGEENPALIAYDASTGDIALLTTGGADIRLNLSGFTNASLLFADNTNIIFFAENSLYIADYINKILPSLDNSLTGDSVVILDDDMPISFDGRCVYYLKQVQSAEDEDHNHDEDGSEHIEPGIYLERVYVFNRHSEEGHMRKELSVRAEVHYPPEEDEVV